MQSTITMSRRCLPIWLAVLSAACASAPHSRALDEYPRGVSGRTPVVYYDIHGRTIEELPADMERLGPKIDGASYVGETGSPMRWSWRSRSMGGVSCSIHDVTVSVTCSQIDMRGNDIARSIVERAHEQQQAYDAETRHGITQGTMFGVRRFTGMTIGDVADTGRLLVAVGGAGGGG